MNQQQTAGHVINLERKQLFVTSAYILAPLTNTNTATHAYAIRLPIEIVWL